MAWFRSKGSADDGGAGHIRRQGTNQHTGGDAPFRQQRTDMVERQLRSRGIRSERVLEAMGTVPRERFLPAGEEHRAYRDQALPLSQGQTVSQPYMVAIMTEALELEPTDRVLEIGTGSGYQTAILSPLAAHIFSIERIPELVSGAREVLAELGFENVRVRVGDGTLGWPEEAPFDAILVTAGAPTPPEPLKAQLREDGGRLVVPVGDRYIQELLRVTRDGDDYVIEELLACRFVPLVGEEGWESP
ncbi:MAG: protein-L-isoaspartate(D-aspartate) O-methyltransferase [Gemmatimonadota bacterium]|jgi:protein-L-isoaspartate(D-aspartate) O-methyltransferase